MGMMAVLRGKLPVSTHRTVLQEGKRIGAPEALAAGIVDDLAGDGAGVVAKAEDYAGRFAAKSKGKAWGLIKAGLYKDAIADMAIDRGNDGLGADVLAKL